MRNTVFCTGKHPLVYQPPPCCRFVQENALWCTNLCLAAVSYRKTPSGVPTSALLPFRTGKHPLVYRPPPCHRFVQENTLWCTMVYQPPPCCRFVQENTLWCTNLRLAAVSYRKTPSGVPTSALLPFRAGKHPLVYQPPPCCRFVQESDFGCTDRKW